MQLTLPQIAQPLQLWEKIHIAVGPDDRQGLYLARIEDFAGNCIVISEPEFLEGHTLLTENCDILVLVTREDAIYQFGSRIHRHDSERRPLFLIDPPVSVRRVQRRQFVRVEIVERIRVALVDPVPSPTGFHWQNAQMENISGNGILVQCLFDVAIDSLLLLEIGYLQRFDLPHRILGRVRRSFKRGGVGFHGIEIILADRLGQFLTAERIETLPESARRFDKPAQHRLVNRIFREQVELRKKGLL